MNFITNIVGTEPLSVGSYIALGLASLLVLQSLVSVIYPLLVTFYNIAWRGDSDYSKYQNMKFCANFDIDDLCFSIVLLDVLTGCFIALCLVGLHDSGNADLVFTLTFLVGFTCAFPYILRYFIDMYKTLQMNTKPGESARLQKLEKEIAEIKKNQTK